MKLAVAVVHEQDAIRAVEVLGSRGFGVTRLNSEGGFLQRRNSLLLMGIDDNLVEEVISTLRSVCKPPVSYTHLDVYKRQLRTSRAGPNEVGQSALASTRM